MESRSLSQNKNPPCYPSALTRESLRRSITLFGSSERSNTPVPYWRLGSGVVNSMVFSLLTFIAELKSNVIFAMEEPEIAIPPHTQRRIVQFLRTKMAQSILTASAVPKVRVNGRSEDVIFFDGVFFESSLKSIFFAS